MPTFIKSLKIKHHYLVICTNIHQKVACIKNRHILLKNEFRNKNMKNYEIAKLNDIEATMCPCGTTKRAFAKEGSPASIHIVEISKEAKTHYHKKMTEIYLILEGEGYLELDGEKVPVEPMTTIMIKPGCRHRAVGNLKIVNIPVPAFDESDEYFD